MRAQNSLSRRDVLGMAVAVGSLALSGGVSFYGLKIHLMVTQDGQPVECVLTPGGFGDVDALKYYAYELPDGAIIYADKAYNDYEIEDLLRAVEHIHLLPMRKKNSKRALSPSVTFV